MKVNWKTKNNSLTIKNWETPGGEKAKGCVHPISHLSEYQQILSKADISQNRSITFKVIKAISRKTRNKLSIVVTSGVWEDEMGNTFYFIPLYNLHLPTMCIFIFNLVFKLSIIRHLKKKRTCTVFHSLYLTTHGLSTL